MRDKMINKFSDISRTNQLQILEKPEDVAEKLFQHLFKMGKGIDHFPLQAQAAEDEDSQDHFSKNPHNFIKSKIQERLSAYGEKPKYSDIQYFLSYADKKKYVIFLSPNKNHSGWQRLFSNSRERILNLVFKFYLLSQSLDVETMNGFEELLLLISCT